MEKLKITVLILFGLSMLTAFGCEKDEALSKEDGCGFAPCDPRKKTVKEVTDQVGRIGYIEKEKKEKKWIIIVSIPQTYDSQDLGIVCGDLAEEFQEVGKMVKFTGKYKDKCDDNRGILPGQTYYYLHVSEISAIKDDYYEKTY